MQSDLERFVDVTIRFTLRDYHTLEGLADAENTTVRAMAHRLVLLHIMEFQDYYLSNTPRVIDVVVNEAFL